MKNEILLTILFMFGIMINHIAVTKLLSGESVVWIYDMSLIWMIAFFFISMNKRGDKNV